MRRVSRYYVHDPENQCQVGDTIRIQETRPISKTKHWRLMEILNRRQVAEVQPIELETDIVAEIAGEVDSSESESELAIAVADDPEEDTVAAEDDNEETTE